MDTQPFLPSITCTKVIAMPLASRDASVRPLSGAWEVTVPVMSALSSPAPLNFPLNLETDALYLSRFSAPPLALIAFSMIDLASPPESARAAGPPARSRAARAPGRRNRSIGDLTWYGTRDGKTRYATRRPPAAFHSALHRGQHGVGHLFGGGRAAQVGRPHPAGL